MSLQGHVGWVWTVKFSPDGKMASCGEDGSIRFWNINTGKSFKFWDRQTGRCLKTLSGHKHLMKGNCFPPQRTNQARVAVKTKQFDFGM
jgi:WD40 repeat protein